VKNIYIYFFLHILEILLKNHEKLIWVYVYFFFINILSILGYMVYFELLWNLIWAFLIRYLLFCPWNLLYTQETHERTPSADSQLLSTGFLPQAPALFVVGVLPHGKQPLPSPEPAALMGRLVPGQTATQRGCRWPLHKGAASTKISRETHSTGHSLEKTRIRLSGFSLHAEGTDP
jgi:hypothetical protein